LFVIERADVIKKAAKLGFPGLTEQSSPAELGAAIVQHWNEKIISSQAAQSITNSYEGILLKTIRGYEYIYIQRRWGTPKLTLGDRTTSTRWW